MPDRSYTPASRWREAGAGLVDAAAFGGLPWLARRRELIRPTARSRTLIGAAQRGAA